MRPSRKPRPARRPGRSHAARRYVDWARALFDPAGAFAKPEALRGVKVIDLGTIFLGPTTTTYLAEYGAEVIKVEIPGVGDTIRALGPSYHWNASLIGLSEPKNKYFVGLDVRKPRGAEVFTRLAARADVLVENFRAGTLERWRIGYRQLREVNPRLIYSAHNGFGQWGAYGLGRPSYDAIAQGESGMAAITGFPVRPPLKSGGYVGDYLGAVAGAATILAALHHRRRTGQGQFVEIAQVEALIRALDWTWVYHGLTGKHRGRYGNADPAIVPSDIVACADAFVALSAPTDEAFAGLARAMGRRALADDPRYRTQLARAQDANREALLALIRGWAREKRWAELLALGDRHGFAAARVASGKDHCEDPHLAARGALLRHDDPLYGTFPVVGPPAKLSATPARVKWTIKPIGWDNEFVFRGLLGLTAGELAGLEREGIVGRWSDQPGQKPPDGWPGEEEARS
ncbi:MAG TPA: CoA transferase [Methylomirabilota bacterium]|nr:CoA transferase [Methylomirabilota bacterium]